MASVSQQSVKRKLPRIFSMRRAAQDFPRVFARVPDTSLLKCQPAPFDAILRNYEIVPSLEVFGDLQSLSRIGLPHDLARVLCLLVSSRGTDASLMDAIFHERPRDVFQLADLREPQEQVEVLGGAKLLVVASDAGQCFGADHCAKM